MSNLKNETIKTLASLTRSFRRWTMLIAIVMATGIFSLNPTVAQAAQGPAVYATINGGGTAMMEGPVLLGTTVWGAGIKLYADGTASGVIHCIDLHDGTSPGNVWGEVTSWFIDSNGDLSLVVASGHIVFFGDGGRQDAGTFIVRVQTFGGRGVGHWTLDVPVVAVPDPHNPADWFEVCVETLTSGQIVIRYP
jgi:hypothetical protein